MSNDGDQIYIDYAQGKPYRECENVSKSYIELRKSLSFDGINGKAEIRCKKRYNLFKITSKNFNTTRVKFFNLVISSSRIVAELGVGAKTEVVFHNMLIRYNQFGIYSKYSTDCSILISNSSFESHFFGGIRLQCFNLTMHIIFSTFKLSPVLLSNRPGTPVVRLWQRTKILFHKTVFDGENTQMCLDMVLVKPFAAVVNITIIDSEFKNHFGFSCLKEEVSSLHIYDHYSKPRNRTLIFFKGLLVENNYNKLPTVVLTVGFFKYTLTEIEIRDSILRNNSEALSLSTDFFGGPLEGTFWSPTIVVKNNTFVDNYCKLMSPNLAAAIYFRYGKFRVLSCRFLDNKATRNPYTAVATISERATATFFDCYFENRQTKVQSNQLFALGRRPLYFLGQNTFNFVALNSRQPVFVRIPIDTNIGMIMSRKFRILCPQGHILIQQGQCVVIKRRIKCYYISVRCEECPTKTYTLERGELIFNKSNDIHCQQCPRGGNCDSGLVTAKPNFWGYKTKMKIIFVQCPPGYCCDSENCITYDSCHGNRSGTLCGQCPEGMSENLFSTPQCISNKECSLNYFFILGTIAMLVLYLVFFLYRKELVKILQTSLFSKRLSFSINSRTEQRNNSTTTGNTPSTSGMIKIFFYYYQVCNLLRSSVGSPKKGQFMYDFENVVSRVMNMVLVNLPSFNCPLKDLRAVPKVVILHSVGYCLLVLLCLLYMINKLFLILRSLGSGDDGRTALRFITTTRSGERSGNSKSSFPQRVASAFTCISLLMYASSAQLCLSLLHCVSIGDNQVLFLDGNIKCYQTFQYFLLAYMISSILPFCLVPVLGSYLLKSGQIGVKQFCVACIFPLPFCCFWLYLLLKNCRCGNQGTYNTIEESDNAVGSQQSSNETQILGSDENENTSQSTESAILKVLLGSFRPQQAFMCFPSSHIPWEGFLILRRLILIIALTFVYDVQLKLFLALTLCVAILILHMLVNPFQIKRDNVLESFSLGTHVVLCGLTLIKALYYGEDYSSFSERFPVLNVIENIVIVAPLSIIMIVVILSIAIKLVFGLKVCVLFLIRKVRRLLRFTM